MKSEKNSIIILCIYVIIMLVACALAVQALRKAVPNEDLPNEDSETKSQPVTEIIYIPIISEDVSESTTEIESNTETEQTEYLIKSHEEKIGIFTPSGTLIRVIDVYTKTLPKADRRLLEKGFTVTGEAELRSILQDYTG